MTRIFTTCRALFASCATLALFVPAAGAQEPSERESRAPQLIEATDTVRIGGRAVPYRIVAGETPIPGADGKPGAMLFSVAYTRADVDDPAARPLVFFFNGGPGAGAAWLHVGAFGPRIVALPEDAGDAGAAPYPIIDNPDSLLDVADLVFVDPIGTGLSRMLPGGAPADFWGVEQDASYLADFIRTYVTRENRWNSPKHLVGESYGALRVAEIADALSANFGGARVNGVVLVSGVVDLMSILPLHGFGEAYVNFLPSYAAAAWRHGRVANAPAKLEDWVAEARAFALGEYASALMQGDRLTPERRAAVAGEVARLTGLTPDYVLQADLKVNPLRFAKELLREEGRVIGRWDARYLGEDLDDAGEIFEADPSAYGVVGAISAGIHHYLGAELGVAIEDRYHLLNRTVASGWDWTTTHRFVVGPSAANAAPGLATAQRQNPDLKILAVMGYYDLATPFLGMESTLATHGFDPERVERFYAASGHMLYVDADVRAALAERLRAFLAP
ncbi:MAG: peptidase S10 [Caulobacterales bacterium]|nr:peptidase S10 [Caulobacterales bacterium]